MTRKTKTRIQVAVLVSTGLAFGACLWGCYDMRPLGAALFSLLWIDLGAAFVDWKTISSID